MSRLLLRLPVSVLVGLVVELAVVAGLGVLTVYPPPPPPVVRDVVLLCRRSSVNCARIGDGIRADMRELDQ